MWQRFNSHNINFPPHTHLSMPPRCPIAASLLHRALCRHHNQCRVIISLESACRIHVVYMCTCIYAWYWCALGRIGLDIGIIDAIALSMGTFSFRTRFRIQQHAPNTQIAHPEPIPHLERIIPFASASAAVRSTEPVNCIHIRIVSHPPSQCSRNSNAVFNAAAGLYACEWFMHDDDFNRISTMLESPQSPCTRQRYTAHERMHLFNNSHTQYTVHDQRAAKLSAG